MYLTEKSVDDKLQRIMNEHLAAQTVMSLVHTPGWQLELAILCLVIDILEYVFNWRESKTNYSES